MTNPIKEPFKLPALKTTSIDEAVEQLDLATSQFALQHDIHCATEVSIAARRYVLAVENYAEEHKQKKIDINDSALQIFFRDINKVHEQFKRIRNNYKKRIEFDKRVTKIETKHYLQRDYDTMGYYLSLLYDQIKRVADLTNSKHDNY